MAEQAVDLQPGESKVVIFEAVPHEAKIYQVSVDGLSGSFVALLAPVSLYGIVTNASTGSPLANVSIIFNGRQTYTNAVGEYAITNLEAKTIGIAFSHIDYEAYQTEITLSPGENKLDVRLTPAVVGRIALKKGYNIVTYTGRSQTVNDAFASIAEYVARVYHFVDSDYYEDICRSPEGVTKMMIPGDNYWVAVYQDCIWTF